MTPEQLQKLNEVYDFVQSLKSDTTIPLDVDSAFRRRFDGLFPVPVGFEDAPLPSISAPTGGLTQDAEARTTINTIITRLEDLGLVEDN